MKNICFIHIPKCGGTSLQSSMKKNWLKGRLKNQKYKLNTPASTKAAQSLGADVLTYREQILRYFLSIDQAEHVVGHFKCSESTRQLFSDNWQFITMIRDPVKRWFSHFYFDRYGLDTKLTKTEMDLQEYLNSSEGFRNSRLYVRHFSSCPDPENITEDHVEEAIRNVLAFDVYGTLERNDLFLKEYHQKTGIKLKMPYVNKNPKKNYKQEVPQEVLDQVTEMCAYDIRIYEQVKNAIEKQEVN